MREKKKEGEMRGKRKRGSGENNEIERRAKKKTSKFFSHPERQDRVRVRVRDRLLDDLPRRRRRRRRATSFTLLAAVAPLPRGVVGEGVEEHRLRLRIGHARRRALLGGQRRPRDDVGEVGGVAALVEEGGEGGAAWRVGEIFCFVFRERLREREKGRKETKSTTTSSEEEKKLKKKNLPDPTASGVARLDSLASADSLVPSTDTLDSFGQWQKPLEYFPLRSHRSSTSVDAPPPKLTPSAAKERAQTDTASSNAK